MIRRCAVAVALLGAALAVAATAVHAAPPSKTPPPKVDVRVARLGPAGCGPFTDSLPPLVIERVGEPGSTTPVVEVCVANRGTAHGRLTMTAADAVDREVDCSPDEATVDDTCTIGDLGDLSGTVVQLATVDPRCSKPPRSRAVSLQAPFTALPEDPLVLHESLHPQQVICVGLRLLYQPATFDDQVRAQSDVLTWRYAFDLRTP